jgi:hypothetical protein
LGTLLGFLDDTDHKLDSEELVDGDETVIGLFVVGFRFFGDRVRRAWRAPSSLF